MNRSVSFLDGLRFLAALGLFVLVYSAVEMPFPQGLSDVDTATGALWLFNVRFLPAFSALLCALAVVRKLFRVVAGFWITMLFLPIYFYFYFFGDLISWIDLAVAVVGLSFILSGLACAMYAWLALDSWLVFRIPPKPTLAQIKKEAAHPSWLLGHLALVSIPLGYANFVIPAIIIVGWCLWLTGIMMSFELIPYAVIYLLLLMPLLGLWVTGRAFMMMLFPEPAWCPAVKMDPSKMPKLQAVIHEVCDTLKSRYPDQVLLCALPNFYVSQSSQQAYNGLVEGRILALGAPFLPWMTLSELKSVLAHEFAHFTGEDTLYYSYFIPVYQSLESALQDLDALSQNFEREGNLLTLFMGKLFLIPRAFLLMIHQYFAVINNLYSWSREIRADAIAARHYGSTPAAAALKTVHMIGKHFDEYMKNFKPVEPQGDFFEQYSSSISRDQVKCEMYLNEALNEEETALDTHPRLATRLALLDQQDASDGDQAVMDSILQELKSEQLFLSLQFTSTIVKNQRALGV